MCDHDPREATSVPDPLTPTTGRGLSIDRRTAVAAAGTSLLLAGALGSQTPAVAEPGGARARGARRRSRISGGTTLVHADLHNHTLLSDGDGDPAEAFSSMRAAGLDVAALTDHTTISDNLLGDLLTGALPPEYRQLAGLTPDGWRRTGELADAADRDGRFTALRGFEWSEPLLGHVNVWFTEHYVDVLQAGLMAPFYAWLRREAGLVLDGGAGGIAGFNHPGREPLRFAEFRYDPRVRRQMVSLEMFNRRDDYLFEGYADGRSSPLSACLDAGWRTGITGVTDEHGTDWGHPEGKGRTGLWVADHSRAGVKRAMLARRFFATRTSGLRLDATAAAPGRRFRPMGSALRMTRGTVRFRLDLARDADWVGRNLEVQVLRPGGDVPAVADVVPFEVGPVLDFRVPLDVADGDWVLLRVADPSLPNATPGPDGHPGNRLGVAYSSPWWITPPS